MGFRSFTRLNLLNSGMFYLVIRSKFTVIFITFSMYWAINHIPLTDRKVDIIITEPSIILPNNKSVIAFLYQGHY